MINAHDDERTEVITIDVSNINTPAELHNLLKRNLGFPAFYGMNWDAFWDAITGLVEMPKKLILVGWDNVIKQVPNDAKIMKKLLDDLNEKYPTWGCTVEYR